MIKLFEISFYLGVILTLITFGLGQFFDFMDFDGPDIDFDADGFNFMSFLKPSIIVLFFTIFGGSGLILSQRGYHEIVTIILAALSGLLGGFLLDRFVISKLKKYETTSASKSDFVGLKARAALDMEGDKVGYIIYQINDNTYQSPAKAFENSVIKKGDYVLIMGFRDNLFYVEKI